MMFRSDCANKSMTDALAREIPGGIIYAGGWSACGCGYGCDLSSLQHLAPCRTNYHRVAVLSRRRAKPFESILHIRRLASGVCIAALPFLPRARDETVCQLTDWQSQAQMAASEPAICDRASLHARWLGCPGWHSKPYLEPG